MTQRANPIVCNSLGGGRHFPARGADFKALREISPPRRAGRRVFSGGGKPPALVKLGRQFRQATSSFVNQRQVSSSDVKHRQAFA
jgi:hypothetical protein